MTQAEKQYDGPQVPLPFYHKDVRKKIGKNFGIMFVSTIIIIILLVIIELLIIGGFYYSYQMLGRISFVIIDNDGGPVGQFFEKALPASNTFGFYVDNTINDPVGFISEAKAWFALQIPYNFSNNFFGALTGRSDVYENNTLYMIYDEGRSYLIISALQAFAQIGIQQAVTRFMQIAIQNNNASLSSIKDYRVLSNPMPITNVPVHPVTYLGEDISSGLALFFVLIVSIATSGIISRTWMSMIGKVKAWQIFLFKQLHAIFAAICIAAFYTIIVVAFKDNHFYITSGLLFLFMIMSVLAIIQFGDFCITVLRIGAVIVIPIFLILSLVSSTAIVMTELMNDFFYVGYGLPMYNIVNGLRYVHFF
jgi:hypothetical protein